MRIPGFTAELSLKKELSLKNKKHWPHPNARALRSQHQAGVVPQFYMCGEDHVLYSCRAMEVFIGWECYSAEASC